MVLTNLQKANIRRTYARIPADQIYPASRVVVRPVMNDIWTGSNFAVSFDNGWTSTVWGSRRTITAIGTDIPATIPVNVITSTPAATLASLPSAVFSIKDSGAHSTTFNLTTAPLTIQSGLAGLLTSLTGISVVGNGSSLSISWATGTIEYCSGSANVNITSSANNVTFSALQDAANVTQNTAWNYIPNALQSLRLLNLSSSPSANAGDYVAVWNGNKLLCISKIVLGSGNGNTVYIPLSDLPGNDIVATNLALAKDGTRYVNGPKECVVKKTQKFYLPGVTAGVNSFTDIPLYVPETDPIRWLQAITAGNTYAVESVSDLTQWMGQILVQELNQVLMSDALTTTNAAS